MTQSLPPKGLVLYADDDADDVELISEAFKEYSQNIELLCFSNGADLIHYVRNIDPLQPAPCLFILDINMPKLNGKETLRHLRDIDDFASIPAVLFSTSTLPSDATFAHSYNAGFITKPLTNHQIHHIIDQMVEHCTDEVKEMIRKRNGK